MDLYGCSVQDAVSFLQKRSDEEAAAGEHSLAACLYAAANELEHPTPGVLDPECVRLIEAELKKGLFAQV